MRPSSSSTDWPTTWRTWAYQADDFIANGYRVLRFDNRDRRRVPARRAYSSRMLADDAKALVDHLGVTNFHLMGISMGGMIVQEYALAYPGDLRSVTIACTYAAPGPFCSRMFAMWAEMASVLGVPFVMRDVTLWAFTVPFFEQRGAELAEFETAMRYMDQPCTPTWHSSRPSRTTTLPTGSVRSPCLPWCWPARRTSSSPSHCRGGSTGNPRLGIGHDRGGHACVWERPAD